MELIKLLKIAINASVKGGHEIMDVYDSDFEVEHKQDNSPLTLADKRCNEIIERSLSLTNIPVLSEEGASIDYEIRKNWEYFWLVDPLDGTKEFVKRNGEFTVNIALIHQNLPVLGVVYVPATHDLYFATKDIGSYKETNVDLEINSVNDLLSSSNKLPSNRINGRYIIVGSRSHMSVETEEFFEKAKKDHGRVEILSIGSSLKLCMVAEGRANAYPRYAPTMEWDTAAGHAIVKYAGFKINQYNTDDEVIYNKRNLLNPWFLVR
tara:strand:+ start:918 stop:1712 length:795 start_codon:yes stop_codon:yes gene_type:complete